MTTTTTPNDLVHYLVERGLLAASSVVDGEVMVVAGMRRNANFTVTRRDGPSYFIKCVQPASPGSAETLQREAAYYRWVNAHPALASLRELLPRFFHDDPQRGLLVLELFRDAQNVADHHRRAGGYPEAIGRLIGRALARHQTATSRVLHASGPGAFRGQTPWVLTLHYTHAQFGQAGSQVATILQSYPDYGRALDLLRRQWQPNTLIHGDMKFENCLVLGGANGAPELRIIDWELADVGEDTWDAGAVVQSYVTACALSTHGTMQVSLEPVQPAIRAFWDEYAQTLAIPEPQRDARLERCVAYAGARMLQTALETLIYAPAMTAHVALVLQISLNILRDPRAAVREIVGAERSVHA